jgi:hypothetical protein
MQQEFAMANVKPRWPAAPDVEAGNDLEGWGGAGVTGPIDRDVEGLGPDGDVDNLDSTHRTPPSASGPSPELGLDPRADDNALGTHEPYGSEAYDTGLGQDPGTAGIDTAEVGSTVDGADTRSR